MNRETLSDLRLLFGFSKIKYRIKGFFLKEIIHPLRHNIRHVLMYRRLSEQYGHYRTIETMNRYYKFQIYKLQKVNESMDSHLDNMFHELYINYGIAKEDFEKWYFNKR